MPTKQTTVPGKDAVNTVCRQNVSKGKSLAGQEDGGNSLKTAAATLAKKWYFRRHEKTLPGFFAVRAAKEGS
jgi:hypothetical protein